MNSTQGSFAHSFIFDVEKNFDLNVAMRNVRENWHYSFYWSGMYIVLMYCLHWYMKDKQPFHLQNVLVTWNFLLAVFNIVACTRGLPEFIAVLNARSVREMFCNFKLTEETPLGSFWIWLFGWSKVWEFGDTLFIILRKRPLRLLHLIHHTFTLIFTWYFVAQEFMMGSWLILMNYIVHSFMYTYYTLRALKLYIPMHVSMSITIMQMVQLFWGFVLPFYVVYIMLSGEPCNATYQSCSFCIVMYGVYFILFANYFHKTYIMGKSQFDKKID